MRLIQAYFKNKKEQQQQQEVDEDFINSLPDDILHIILSKLPIRDAAVTTAVSKRWAPLFPTLPSLDIHPASFNPVNPGIDSDNDDESNVEDVNGWVEALFSVLYSRRAPVQKFEIGVEILDSCGGDFYEVFDDLCAAGVQELAIRNYKYYDDDIYEIPWPVFSCNTIVKLEMVNCVLDVPSKFTGLRAVKSLELIDVTVADNHLRRLISRCKAIEKLVITDCKKIKNIVIRAPSLLELVISLFRPFAISLKSSPRLANMKVSFGYCLIDEYSEDEYSDGGFGLNNSEKTFEGTNLMAFLNGLLGVKNLRLHFSNVYRMELQEESETTRKIQNELLTMQLASPDVEIVIKPIISRFQIMENCTFS